MRINDPNYREQGFVLITVLLVVVLLTALLLQFHELSRQSLAAADGFSHRVQALQYARAGLSVVREALGYESSEIKDDLANRIPLGISEMEFEYGRCVVTVQRENGKCNVNRLKQADGSLNRFSVDQMLRLIDLLNARQNNVTPISYAVAPAMIDWIDQDDQITLLSFVRGDNAGAESDYYLMNGQGRCRNQPLESVDELLGVRGVTSTLLYGSTEQAAVNTNGGLADYITVYGDGMIDINSADEVVIQSLDVQITAELAELIAAQRQQKPFERIGELKDMPGMTSSIYSRIAGAITVEPKEPVYHVACRGITGQYEKTITAIMKKNKSDNDMEIIWYTE